MKSLLLLSCSKKKRLIEKSKAYDIYDGVFYRVLKKNLINFDEFEIYILSAKYGFISKDENIRNYDLKMNTKIATELYKNNNQYLDNINLNRYKKVFVCMGKTYLNSFDIKILPQEKTEIISGGIGQKMKRLKEIVTDV